MSTHKRMNPAFKYVAEINQICKGLFRRLGLNAFSFSQVYSDGSRSELWTDAEALDHSFFTKQYIQKIYTPHLFDGKKYVLYDIAVEKFPEETKNRLIHQLKDQREIFNHDNCLFVINYQVCHTEYFAFYTDRSEHTAINNYLNNTEVLDKFCKYFRQRAKPLIIEAEKNKLIQPWRNNQNSIEAIQEEKSTEILLGQKTNNPKIILTLREKEIGDLLCEGMTAKEASDVLCVTQKTIEKHIENIKNKTGLSRRAMLLNFLSNYEE